MLIHGACHCRNIVLTLDWTVQPLHIAARVCGCSFCCKHGGVWTSCPGGRLQVAVRERAAVTRYAFGTRTAQFHICTHCGVVPVVSSEIAGRPYAVVNVNALEDLPPGCVQQQPTNFDGEDEVTRLARRQKNWIADVAFVYD